MKINNTVTYIKDGIFMRICRKCHAELPLTIENFNKRKHTFMGFSYFCNNCIGHYIYPREDVDFKKCSDCGETYPRTDEYFYRSKKTWHGFFTICKKCVNIRGRAAYEKRKNTAEYKEQTYRRSRKWLDANEDHAREWRANYYSKKYKEDVEYKIMTILRQRVRSSLNGETKRETTISLLGCDIGYFKTYISSLFKEGMTWENHGRGLDKWHFDHIRPCASFDLTDTEQQKQCFHYTNIQPLWESENLKKFSSYKGIAYRKKTKKNVNIK